MEVASVRLRPVRISDGMLITAADVKTQKQKLFRIFATKRKKSYITKDSEECVTIHIEHMEQNFPDATGR